MYSGCLAPGLAPLTRLLRLQVGGAVDEGCDAEMFGGIDVAVASDDRPRRRSAAPGHPGGCVPQTAPELLRLCLLQHRCVDLSSCRDLLTLLPVDLLLSDGS